MHGHMIEKMFHLFSLILMLKYFGVICLVLHILLNQMTAFVFSNYVNHLTYKLYYQMLHLKYSCNLARH